MRRAACPPIESRGTLRADGARHDLRCRARSGCAFPRLRPVDDRAPRDGTHPESSLPARDSDGVGKQTAVSRNCWGQVLLFAPAAKRVRIAACAVRACDGRSDPACLPTCHPGWAASAPVGVAPQLAHPGAGGHASGRGANGVRRLACDVACRATGLACSTALPSTRNEEHR